MIVNALTILTEEKKRFKNQNENEKTIKILENQENTFTSCHYFLTNLTFEPTIIISRKSSNKQKQKD